MTDASVAPVREASRIKSLDVMRGFAVLGILIVNATLFAVPSAANGVLRGPLAVDDATMWSWWVMHVFFEFKCITLFSLLFGASMVLVGGDGSDSQRNVVLTRRLWWLLVFGLIHGLVIWYGDVLFTYALTGLLVMFARGWRPVVLLCVGFVLFALSLAVHTPAGEVLRHIPLEVFGDPSAGAGLERPQRGAAAIAGYQSGLAGAMRENFAQWLAIIENWTIILVVRTAGVMMIGMALLKAGFLSGNARSWLYLLFAAAGAVSLAVIVYQAGLNWEAQFDRDFMRERGLWANMVLSLVVAIGYASACVLMVKAGWRIVTEPLGAVGRMAFTNYIAQSVIMTSLFWGGRGFGLMGEVDRVTLTGIVVAVWAAQLIWSPLWLSRFSMGPLEWLWRRLSYGRAIAIGKA